MDRRLLKNHFRLFRNAISVVKIIIIIHFFQNTKLDIESQERANHLRVQPKGQVQKKRHSVLPYLNVISGKSKEWTNIEHSQPLKRSDNNLTDSLFKKTPLITNECISNNNGNTSKFPCPINLLYGNNLTVKNFFLMMPEGNFSCMNHSQIEKAFYHEKIEQKQPNLESSVSQTGEFGNLDNITEIPEKYIITLSTEKFSQSEVIAQEASSSEVRLGVFTESTVIENRLSGTDNFLTQESASKEVPSINISSTTTSESTLIDFESNNINNLGGSVNRTVNTSEEILRPTENINHRLETLEVTPMKTSTIVDNVNISLATENHLSLPQIVTVPSSESISVTNQNSQTTPILKDDILRTIDKYCETLSFNLSDDNGTYILNPVSISQTI